MLSKVITIAQQKGGTGKTTLAVNLALAFIKYHNLKVAIIDTPPKIESDARPAIEAANLVLIPVAPSPVDFWATESIIEIAKKAKRKILIQINRANHRSKLISKTHEYIKSINVKSTDTLIGHRQIFVSSMGEGKTVVEKQRKSKAVEEIKSISNQILLELN